MRSTDHEHAEVASDTIGGCTWICYDLVVYPVQESDLTARYWRERSYK
jgi:hypothetical protein